MLRDPHRSEFGPLKRRQRKRVGKRTLLACINCKERKLKCDDQIPCCANCQRFGFVCLVEDPATKRHQPRNYLETLEERVVYLERIITQHNDAEDDPLPQSQDTLRRHNPALSQMTAVQLPEPDEERENASSLGNPNEDYDEGSDLASKVGMLSFAAGAEPHYLGSSSTFAFSRVINSALLQAVSRKPGGRARHQPGKGSLPTPCLLPDYDDCVKLSDAYFREVHAQYPFLHEPSFRLWEVKIMPSHATDVSHLDPASLFFLYMRLYAAAQLYVDDVLQLESLEAIQAYLCYAVYSLRSPAGTSVWRLSGLALRQCVELGYHRRSRVIGTTSQSSALRIELRKRAFWCAWTIDMMAATILGRPLALQQHEVDCEYPLDIDDMYISDCGVLGTVRSPRDLPTKITKALFTFRIRCLWGRIHTLLYSDIDQHRSSGPAYQVKVDQLRHELDEWRASLPPTVPHRGEMLSMFSAVEWFDLCYNHTIIYLYRGQLTCSTDPATNEVFLECMQAAENLCHGYRREILGKPTTYTWGALHTIFVAGLTYLHCLWSSITVRETVRQDVVSSTCTDCTIVLVLIAQWNESAAPYRDIFEELASRTMTMLVEKERQRSIFPEAASQPDLLDSDNFTQWVAEISEGGMADGLGELLNGLVGEMPVKE